MPVFVSACIVVIVGAVTLRTTFRVRSPDAEIATLSQEEIDMIQDLELVENYDIISEMDVLQEMDIIDSMGRYQKQGIQYG